MQNFREKTIKAFELAKTKNCTFNLSFWNFQIENNLVKNISDQISVLGVFCLEDDVQSDPYLDFYRIFSKHLDLSRDQLIAFVSGAINKDKDYLRILSINEVDYFDFGVEIYNSYIKKD